MDYAVRRGGEKALAETRDLFGYLPLKLAIAEGSLQPLVHPGNNEIE